MQEPRDADIISGLTFLDGRLKDVCISSIPGFFWLLVIVSAHEITCAVLGIAPSTAIRNVVSEAFRLSEPQFKPETCWQKYAHIMFEGYGFPSEWQVPNSCYLYPS